MIDRLAGALRRGDSGEPLLGLRRRAPRGGRAGGARGQVPARRAARSSPASIAEPGRAAPAAGGPGGGRGGPRATRARPAPRRTRAAGAGAPDARARGGPCFAELDGALYAALATGAEPDSDQAVRALPGSQGAPRPSRSSLRDRQQPPLPRGRSPHRAVPGRRARGPPPGPRRIQRATRIRHRLPPGSILTDGLIAGPRGRHRRAAGSRRAALPLRPGADAGLRDRPDPRRRRPARAGQRDHEPQRGRVPAPVSRGETVQSLGQGLPRRQEPAARDPRADHPAQPLPQQPAATSPPAPLPPHRPQPVDPGAASRTSSTGSGPTPSISRSATFPGATSSTSSGARAITPSASARF